MGYMKLAVAQQSHDERAYRLEEVGVGEEEKQEDDGKVGGQHTADLAGELAREVGRNGRVRRHLGVKVKFWRRWFGSSAHAGITYIGLNNRTRRVFG